MKKILVIKHGSLGDIIFSLPVLDAIKNNFIDSEIYILTERKYFDLFYKSPIIYSCIEDDRKKNFFYSIFNLIKLKKFKFDFIIDLQNSKRTSAYNFFFRILGDAKICSSRPFAHYRYYIPTQGTESSTQGLFNQISLIGVKNNSNTNYDWLKIELKDKFTKPIVLFIPGVSKGGESKQWQPEKFAKLAKYIENKGYDICVIGTKNDMNSVSPILDLCENVINKIDKSPPEIIYSLALESSLIISNDTGPGHLASLAKRNLIWLANDNKISKANLNNSNYFYKLLSSSVKRIEVEYVIDIIEKNKLI